MNEKMISVAVIRRLPKYHRYLSELMDEGVDRISSSNLSKIIGFSASQIRQDLNNFGGFGQQGYGYNVKALHTEIANILGLNRHYKTVIVGAGNIGKALAKYSSFKRFNFDLMGIFDNDSKKIGNVINGVEVMEDDLLSDYIKKHNIDIAFLCTNKTSAQKTADILCDSGIKGIWNFTPVDLDLKEGVVAENIHLIENLFTLTYFLNQESK